ncbi:DUF4136 domain-containing protein [Agaribacterium sp. ZY112]|uniref:DUF4136 domain-containing protein n=1 Tax=Agaribacterium sp. ZY112 TaxID=3233574 RepID=UPI0035260931
MKKLSLLGVLFSVVLMQACSSKDKLEVSTDYQSFDYSGVKTYHWYDGDDTEQHAAMTSIAHERIKSAIDVELAKKGFIERADGVLEVNYSVNARDRADVHNYQVYDGMAPGFTWNRDEGGSFLKTREEYTETEIENYREGILIIDVLEATGNKLLWRGTGKRRLPEVMMNKEELDRVVKDAVANILADFPPKP